MNKTSYARLPDAAKRAIDANAGEAFTTLLGKSFDEYDDQARAKVKAMANQEIRPIPAGEVAEWKHEVQPVIDGWVKATPDGAHVLAAYRAEVAKLESAK